MPLAIFRYCTSRLSDHDNYQDGQHGMQKEKGDLMIIRVCPGIGDNIWLVQKLLNANRKFEFEIAADHLIAFERN